MEQMKKISIIIPCYNMEQYIERCYQSLQAQSGADDVEFIFVNDGSTDNTLSKLSELKSIDSRVVIIDQKNAGVSAARNAAVVIAKGEYIYLLDGDDYLTENAISDIKQVLEIFHPDLLISAYNTSRNNIESYRPLPCKEGLFRKKVFFASIPFFPTAPQLVYRTDIIKDKNITFNSSIKCGEVYDFTINYMQYIDSIYVLNKPTFNYWQRNDSAIHQPKPQNDITIINALNSIYQNGGDLVTYGSFIVTAFKLMRSFSYTKYLKYSKDLRNIEFIENILSDTIVKQCIKDTLIKPHKLINERLIALYIYIMPKRFGFTLLNRLIK